MGFGRFRILVAAVLAVSFGALAPYAASAAEKQFVITGGGNFSTLAGDAEEAGDLIADELEIVFPGTSWGSSTKTRTGFDLGAEVVIPISTAFALQPGLHYSQRGGKWEFSENSGTGVNADGTVKMNYIEAPLLLRVGPPTDSNVKVFFNLGPVVGFRVASTFDVEASNGGEDSDDLDDATNSVNFGAQGGVGLDIGMGPTSSIVVQTRYHLGFTNIFDDEAFSVKHSDAMIQAGFAKKFGGP
ncbi:MAG: porin family protein [Candidatus Eiseniibacteriota bacterium]